MPQMLGRRGKYDEPYKYKVEDYLPKSNNADRVFMLILSLF